MKSIIYWHFCFHYRRPLSENQVNKTPSLQKIENTYNKRKRKKSKFLIKKSALDTKAHKTCCSLAVSEIHTHSHIYLHVYACINYLPFFENRCQAAYYFYFQFVYEPTFFFFGFFFLIFVFALRVCIDYCSPAGQWIKRRERKILRKRTRKTRNRN